MPLTDAKAFTVKIERNKKRNPSQTPKFWSGEYGRRHCGSEGSCFWAPPSIQNFTANLLSNCGLPLPSIRFSFGTKRAAPCWHDEERAPKTIKTRRNQLATTAPVPALPASAPAWMFSALAPTWPPRMAAPIAHGQVYCPALEKKNIVNHGK
jgi:hypothetical protein